MPEHKSFVDRVRAAVRDNPEARIALGRAQRVASTVKKVSQAIKDVAAKPTVLGAAAAGLEVASSSLESWLTQAGRPSGCASLLVPDVLVPFLDRFAVPNERGTYRMGDQYVIKRDDDADDDLFVWVKDVNAYRRAMREVVWPELGPYFDVSRSEPPEPSLPSSRADAVWRRVEPLIAAGHSRAILLDGKPGTGKTSIARNLAERAGRCIRVPNLRGSLYILAWTLAPDCLIIDDFDRLSGSHTSQCLDDLASLRDSVKLLIVTTNNVGALDPAVVRPGRFDELFTIDSLGEDHARHMCGDRLWFSLTPENRAAIVQWPAAFVHELRLRFDNLHTDPNLEIATLAPRVENNARPTWAAGAVRSIDDLA